MKTSGSHVHMYEDTHMNMYIAHTPPHIATFPKVSAGNSGHTSALSPSLRSKGTVLFGSLDSVLQGPRKKRMKEGGCHPQGRCRGQSAPRRGLRRDGDPKSHFPATGGLVW